MAEKGIELQKLKKIYMDNIVLDIDDVFLPIGYVYGLVGTNGVGKTTLLQIIEGSVVQDEGSVESMDLNIEMIHHDIGLFTELSVYENMFMGIEPSKNYLGVISGIDWKKIKEDSRLILEKYNLDIDIEVCVNELDNSTQKLLEIIIALSHEPDVLIIDEPISFLDIHQVAYLNQLVGDFINQDRIVIYSSHRLDELFSVVDKIITMRDRKIVAIDDATENLLASMLEFSEKVVHKYPKRRVEIGKPILEVDNLCSEYIRNISFKLNKGEILGIVGLRGAYKSQIGRALFGAVPFEGKIWVDGSEKRIRSTNHAVEAGICYMGNTNEGVFLDDSLLDNIVSANVPRARKLSRSAKKLISKYYLEMLNIHYEHENQSMDTISVGNKQKVMLAKWFFSKSRIFIFNKPTSNIDTVSKVDIYNIFVDLVETGAGIVLISNDLEEIAGMCDRVLVIEKGSIKTEIPRNKLSVHGLVEAMQNW